MLSVAPETFQRRHLMKEPWRIMKMVEKSRELPRTSEQRIGTGCSLRHRSWLLYISQMDRQVCPNAFRLEEASLFAQLGLFPGGQRVELDFVHRHGLLQMATRKPGHLSRGKLMVRMGKVTKETKICTWKSLSFR